MKLKAMFNDFNISSFSTSLKPPLKIVNTPQISRARFSLGNTNHANQTSQSRELDQSLTLFINIT